MLIASSLTILGLLILIFGADLMVRGAVRLSHRFGIPMVIIGLTVVAFGTSAPEFAVCIISAFQSKPDLAVGNIIGSNLFNVLIVLGIASLIIPSQIHSRFVKADVPIMLVATIFALVFCWDGVFSVWEGWVFFLSLIIFLLSQYFAYKKEKSKELEEEIGEYISDEQKSQSLLVSACFLFFGILGLSLGSHWFVEGSAKFARIFGVNELSIGLSLVAFGTSLPELATSVMAALRRQNDIVVGNVIGSNIFNILGVLGLTAALSGSGLAISNFAFYFDLPLLIMVSFACLPIFWTGFRIYRWEGFCFCAIYGFFAYYIFDRQSSNLDSFDKVLFYGGIPICILTLASLVENIFSKRPKKRRKRTKKV